MKPMRLPTSLLIAVLLTSGSTVFAGDRPLHEIVDDHIAAGWKERGVTPASLSDDAEFIRRIHLDLTGMIPRAAVVEEFLRDRTPGRRERWIDSLAASAEFNLHMARVVDAMLIERRVNVIRSYDVPVKDWRDYLASAFAADRPWDRLAAEILGSDGSDPKIGAAVKFYVARNVDSHELTRDISRLFLGRDLACAQCHDDPRIKDYTQEEYYGIYAFVSRMSFYRDLKARQSLISEKAEGPVKYESVFTGKKGLTDPRLRGGAMLSDPVLEKGKEYVVLPKPGGRAVPVYSRRALLARELPRPETPGFSRTIVNRLWALVMGRGLVHPLDLDHPGNPPSHPALLDELVRRFEAMNYDVRGFLRELMRSKTYQLSSRRADGTPEPPAETFAVAALRPLSPDQLAWSVLQATGRLAGYEQAAEVALEKREPDTFAATKKTFAWRHQMYAGLEREVTLLATQFSGPAGAPEGSFEPTVNQALFLLNAPTVVNAFQPSKSRRLVDVLAAEQNPAVLAERMYLAVLSRRPDADEVAEVRRHLAASKDRAVAVGELASALLLSAEFRLNH
jgi:hypothetical protein